MVLFLNLFSGYFGCMLCVLMCMFVQLVLSSIVVVLFVPSVPIVCPCVVVVGFFIWRVLGRVMVCDSISSSSSSSSNSIGLLVILFSFFLLRLV